ncbi:hypothetical protein [Butyrivibrio sp. FC2001]|nr:hypothetical protein [Butyrivibrio sp. FC2001]
MERASLWAVLFSCPEGGFMVILSIIGFLIIKEALNQMEVMY